MGLRLRAATVRGPGHIADGLPNQDAVLIRHGRRDWLAVVADGMGSRRQAALGARAACTAVRRAVREQSFDSDDHTLIRAVYSHWLDHLAQRRVLPADAVTTCLFAWGLPDGRFRLLQLGDGLILGHPEPVHGLVQRPGGVFSNETTGLGLSRRYADWHGRRGRLDRRGDGLLLMSDGLSEDLVRTDGLVLAVIASLRGRGARSARAALGRELHAWPTPGHSDDKSLAVIYRT
ncbi:MAG: protein phosphatase 2C domain-containing protein [Proteobacteria bacterium]|nr:protein phosphatase 2C domain-containing protein [Pseudomonadota bacterium]